jgi:hypothetical protein
MTEEERKEFEQLREDNEDYQRSFELFRKATQALHKLYPHSDGFAHLCFRQDQI